MDVVDVSKGLEKNTNKDSTEGAHPTTSTCPGFASDHPEDPELAQSRFSPFLEDWDFFNG